MKKQASPNRVAFRYLMGMTVDLGERARKKTWQQDFPPEATCVHCGKPKAPLAFVAYEGLGEKPNPKKLVFELHKTEPGKKGKLWLHDACAVAVYFCRHCLEPTAKYNQG